MSEKPVRVEQPQSEGVCDSAAPQGLSSGCTVMGSGDDDPLVCDTDRLQHTTSDINRNNSDDGVFVMNCKDASTLLKSENLQTFNNDVAHSNNSESNSQKQGIKSVEDNHVEEKMLNPFIHRIEMQWPYDYIKVAVLSVLLLPVRIFFICVSLLCAYIVSSLGLWGVTRERLEEKPLDGWRGKLRWGMGWCGRLMIRSYGFHVLRIKGKLASRSEAPMIVVAPHSSFFDGVAVYWSKVPGLVSRRENLDIPLFGKYIDYTQPVYVWRESTNSRQKTIQEIMKRATSKDNWPQVMVFPEGTCTNRSCLITFKPGAFYPGVPVQPVVIRYNNKMDTTTWTWDGPGALKLLLLTLSQFHNYCELEYLPVYHPNEAEKKDANLYAANVRAVMAKALGVPTVDYTFDDCRIMHKARKSKLPTSIGLIEFQKLKQKFGITMKDVEDCLEKRFAKMANKKTGTATMQDFASYLNLPATEPTVVHLFNLYDSKHSGKISFRDYLIGYWQIAHPSVSERSVEALFNSFSANAVSVYEVKLSVMNALKLTEQQTQQLFAPIQKVGKENFVLEDFQYFAQQFPEYMWLYLRYRDSVRSGERQESYSVPLQDVSKSKTE